MKILFLVPYPLKESPSQRFRFEQYFETLSRQGYHYDVQSFLESHNWQLFFKKGKQIAKAAALVRGFSKRIAMLFSVSKYDFIFIHREASPLGPPIFEWIIAKIFYKKIIYDFDDAIWLTDRTSESPILRFLKWRQKVANICRWSHKISCGNDYLCQFALRYNPNTILNPTTIDTDNVHNPLLYKKAYVGGIKVGWTGSHSTLKYLKNIEGVLQNLEKQFPEIMFIVIADRPADLQLNSMRFVPWNVDTEIADLAQLDIGIMPLPDDEWSKGKCGFKALQYMALEIATVASPVGVNTQIVSTGVNGLLASSDDEWLNALRTLITNNELRQNLAKSGRAKIIADYSVAANTANFLRFFGDSETYGKIKPTSLQGE